MGEPVRRTRSRGPLAFLILAAALLTSLVSLPTPARAATVTVSVLSPAGNETFSGNTSRDIVWYMDSDSGNPGLNVDLAYLLDGMPTTIEAGLSYPSGMTSRYSWTIPAPDLTNVSVRVCASDVAGGFACDTSPPFEIDGTAPTVLSNSPVGTNVGPLEDIVIRFSELMNRTGLLSSFSITPAVQNLSLAVNKVSSTTTELRGNHSGFTPGRTYAVTVSCAAVDDSDPGNPVDSCPHSWTFRAATPPSLTWRSPDGGKRWTGGTVHELQWDASDQEDPSGSLSVYLDYTLDGSSWTAIVGPIPGDATHSWTLPAVDVNAARVRARVVDTRGLDAAATSAPFAIDATAPAVAATSPADGQTEVAWRSRVLVSFSEPMDTTSGAETFSLRSSSGAHVAGVISWDSPQVARFVPDAPLVASTAYVARINVTATDASDPGNPLADLYEFTFVTEANAGPSVSFATFPSGSISGGSVWLLSWNATDPEDAPGDLRIDLDFSDGGPFVSIAGPLGSTETYAWDAPRLDTNSAALRVTVTDSQAGVATDLAPFTVDSTSPAVAVVDPVNGAVDISPAASVVVTFSEPVDATGIALRTVAGAWVPSVATWDAPSTLRLTPARPLAEAVEHEVVVNASVRDLSVPGNPLGTTFTSRFRVASIPPVVSVTSPVPGTRWTAGATQTISMIASDAQDAQITLTVEFALDGTSFVPLLWTTIANGASTVAVSVPRWDAPDGVLRICVADGAGARTCTTIPIVLDAEAPRILSMSPLPGTVAHPESPIVVTFSESMSPSTVEAFTLAPESTLTFRWTRTAHDNDTLTIEHPRLLERRGYTATFVCTARDASVPGIYLGGACPFSWTFTAAANPSIYLLYPIGGERLTAGVLHTIRWSSADEERTLLTRVELTLDGGVTWTPLEEGSPFPTGDTSLPRFFPRVDSVAAAVRVIARDSWGLSAMATSHPFATDATPPRIVSVTPADGATGVDPQADLVVVFSESMNEGFLEVGTEPKVGTRAEWEAVEVPSDRVVIRHDGFKNGEEVRWTIEEARDASTPGNLLLGPPNGFGFVTEPDGLPPSVRISFDGAVEEGEVLVLDATSSSDNEGISSYRWTITDYGGQRVATLDGPRVEYLANDPGRLNVTVEVADRAGNKGVASADVTVYALGSITQVTFPPDPLLGWVALGGSASSTAWSLTDRSRSFLSRMILLPLYVKMKGPGVLDNELRGMIRGYVLVNPGDCYTDIKRNLQLQNGELAYHLSVLQREGIIKSVTRGAKRVYYPATMSVPEDAGGLHEVQQRLLQHVVEVPGMSVHELAGLLGVSSQLALYHMRKLGEMGHVRFERERMKLRVYATDEPSGQGPQREDANT